MTQTMIETFKYGQSRTANAPDGPRTPPVNTADGGEDGPALHIPKTKPGRHVRSTFQLRDFLSQKLLSQRARTLQLTQPSP